MTPPGDSRASFVDAENEIAFVRELIGRTAFPAQQLESITKDVLQVEARTQDETLYLAVLGEFNSGKSTFVNALLRRRLLRSAPRATTAAATLIRFAPEFSLRVHFKDGSVVAGIDGDCATLRNKILSVAPNVTECFTVQDILDQVTVDPPVVSHVVKVELNIPAATLRSGISIIDTPGIGAGADYAQQHQAVTERVIADTADVAVILIPADNAMTKTLMDFLTDTTQRFLHRCVFVITKMDHVEEPDQASVLEYVHARLSQLVGKKPLILQSAAATMLPVKEIPPSLRESWSYWRASFSTMEKSLHQELARNRAVIIAERLTALLHSLLMGLQDAIANKRTSLAQERSALERNSVVELERVLASLLEQCRAEIDAEVEKCKLRTRSDGASFESRAVLTANELLDGADKNTLAGVVQTGVPHAVSQHQRDFDQAGEIHLKSLCARCERVERIFVEQFESNYRSLRALGVKIEVPRFAQVSESIPKGHFSSAGDFLHASEQTRARVGAGVGATAGCIGAPVSACFGAVIGLLLGGCAVGHGSIDGASLVCCWAVWPALRPRSWPVASWVQGLVRRWRIWLGSAKRFAAY